ncbi:MAG: precorrin-6A reductase [Firmicutes bacterium]|nr:precorrin-6A reductase [Bacillota bacterium]
MSKILLFAGTTEGKNLAAACRDQNLELWVSVATDYGKTRIEPADNIHVLCGRKDAEGIGQLLEEIKPELVIDATHPYAAVVTENVKSACGEKGVEYIRLLRDGGTEDDSFVFAEDTESAAAFLNTVEGKVLLTTGSKELDKYTAVKGFEERIYARILPMPDGIKRAMDLGYPCSHIIGMQGPFSYEINKATMEMLGVSYMVTKVTGAEGGFTDKVEAASDCGVKSIVIKRPAKEEGLSYGECLGILKERYGVEPAKEVTVLGIGMGDKETLTLEADKACRDADLIIGAKRIAESLSSYGKPLAFAIAPKDIERIVRESAEQRFVVAMSGDTGFYSGTKKLLPLLSDLNTKVLPGISSIPYFCSLIGESWDDALLVSAHGRYCNLVGKIKNNPKVFALTGGDMGIKEIAKALCENGLGTTKLVVGENLSYENERITAGTAEELKTLEFDSLAVMLAKNEEAGNALVTQGLEDDAFLRAEVPMTKQEIRAVTLAKLKLSKNSVCWDVGAGTGSVSLEMAKAAEDGFVYAVEKNEDACTLIESNMKHLGITNVEVVRGLAPEALSDLPAPSHVFIGGSSGSMIPIIQAALEKNPSVRIVMNTVTVESLSDVQDAVKALGLVNEDYVQLSAARGRKVGRYHLMTAQNPVFIVSCDGPGSIEGSEEQR